MFAPARSNVPVINARTNARRSTSRARATTTTRASASANDEHLDRRAALFGLSTAALASAFGVPLGAIADEEEKAKKVVAVPYTKYVVQKESSEEAIAVAKQLKEAGGASVRGVLVRKLQQAKGTVGKRSDGVHRLH